jgi:hypothetical protein
MVDVHGRTADMIFPQADVAPELFNVTINYQAPAKQSVTM